MAGAGRYRMVGVLTQRALVVISAFSVLVVCAWLFASPLLEV